MAVSASPVANFEVANINAAQTFGLAPYDLLATDAGLIFTANDGIHGWELWTSDGTAAGTSMLHDLAPGSASSINTGEPALSSPIQSSATVLGEDILFFADDGTNGTSLYRTDQATGEFEFLRFIDTYIGPQYILPPPRELVTVGDEVYFVGGGNLWKSNGTTEGTQLIAQPNGWPSRLVSFQGRLFLNADYALSTLADSGRGTQKIIPNITNIRRLRVFGDHLYVFTDKDVWTSTDGERFNKIVTGSLGEFSELFDDGNGFQYFNQGRSRLYKSDGSAAGTNRAGTGPLQFIGAFDGKAIYARDYSEGYADLWMTDGTDRTKVADGLSLEGNGVALGDQFLFFANDRIHGTELWVSDGTEEGTHLLLDIYPGPEASVELRETELVHWQDRVYFRASNGTDGVELWSTDGTTAGTQMVLNNQRSEDSTPQHIAVMNDGTGIFAADDGTNDRTQIWKTQNGITSLVYNLPDPNPKAFQFEEHPSGVYNVQLQEFVSRGDRVFFLQRYNYLWGSGNYQHAFDLWSTDGTSDGTVLVQREPFSHYYRDGMFYEPRIVFDKTGVASLEANSVRFIPDGGPLPEANQSLEITIDDVVYSAQHTETNFRNWFVSASPNRQPTASLIEFQNVDHIGHLTEASGSLVFVVKPEATSELWGSDGSRAGTQLIRSFEHPIGVESFADGEFLYFAVEDPQTGDQLWRSDGTSDGTIRLSDQLRDPNAFAQFRGETYFSAVDDVVGRELWKTDGSTEGTQLVADLLPGIASSSPSDLATNEEELFFSAVHAQLGRELWNFLPQGEIELQADVDNNGAVDFADFLILSANFGNDTTSGKSAGDLTLDGAVNFDDFLLLADEFGQKTTQG